MFAKHYSLTPLDAQARGRAVKVSPYQAASAVTPTPGDGLIAMLGCVQLRQTRPQAQLADFVLIDMPPSRAAGFHETLFAADYLIIPTLLERLSFQGVALMAETITLLRQDKGAAPGLLGIIPNMFRPVNEHRDNLAELARRFGARVWAPAPQSIRVAEAIRDGLTIFEFDPNHPAARAFAGNAQRILINLEA